MNQPGDFLADARGGTSDDESEIINRWQGHWIRNVAGNDSLKQHLICEVEPPHQPLNPPQSLLLHLLRYCLLQWFSIVRSLLRRRCRWCHFHGTTHTHTRSDELSTYAVEIWKEKYGDLHRKIYGLTVEGLKPEMLKQKISLYVQS